jgi:hypothetical protein
VLRMFTDEELLSVRVPPKGYTRAKAESMWRARLLKEKIARNREAAKQRKANVQDQRERNIDEYYANKTYGPFGFIVADIGDSMYTTPDGKKRKVLTERARITMATFSTPPAERASDEWALKRTSRWHLVQWMKEEGINPEILRKWMREHPRLKGEKGRERIQDWEAMLAQEFGGRKSKLHSTGSWHKDHYGDYVFRGY